MSQGTHGHSTTLAGATAGTVGNIMSISGPSQVRDSLDISTMDSLSKNREFISGMRDSGEATIELNYDGSSSGTADALNVAFQLGAVEIWTITFPDASSWVCPGFITALDQATPFDDKITQTLTLKFTADPAGLVDYPTFTDVA